MTRRGYTIVEMMMVTAIFLIILSMAISAWINSGSGTRLRSAASQVYGQLNLARAKAVAERRCVVLYFAGAKAEDEYPGYACQLRYSDDVNDDKKNKPLPGADWVVLPTGTVFSAAQPAGSSSAVLAVPSAVVFDAKGRLKDFSGTTTTKLYVVVGEQTKYSSLTRKSANEDSYFAIEINPFSGRATTTFHVNEN